MLIVHFERRSHLPGNLSGPELSFFGHLHVYTWNKASYSQVKDALGASRGTELGISGILKKAALALLLDLVKLLLLP